MRYFDLHCDTLTEALRLHLNLDNNSLQVSFADAKNIEQYYQLFAVFIPDTLRGPNALSYFLQCAQAFTDEIFASPNAGFFKDKNARCHAMLSVEGGSACGGTLEGLSLLRQNGVQVMTLTWNGDNEIASGCFSESDRGFTDFGREAVRTMRQLGMIPDISHLSKKSFSQLIDFDDGVLIATHSNYDLTDNPYGRARNLSPFQAKEIVARGGLIGLNFCPDFLSDTSAAGYDDIMRHIDAFLSIGAERSLAFGGDFDGCQPVAEVCSLSRIPALYQALLARGLSRELAERIFWRNAFDFFSHIGTI